MRRDNPIDGKNPPKPFRYSADKEITIDVINKFILKHLARKERYEYLMRMYNNNTEIFEQEEKDAWKPDNRLSVGYARYITDTFSGYFIGTPVHKQHKKEAADELVRLFDDDNDIEDQDSELARLACIYGHAFEIVYQDERAKTCVTYATPEECFIVYDTTKQMDPLFAVYFYTDEEDMTLEGTVYTRYGELIIRGYAGDAEIVEARDGMYPVYRAGVMDDEEVTEYAIPVIEYMFNENRTGIFEGVTSLINAFNKALSEKANDVDYYADAYLAVLGMELDDKGAKNIRDNRLINAFSLNDAVKVDIKFLDKPDSDGTQENLLERMHKLIFQMSMVADISDESFGATSGVALEYKYQAMSNLAQSFQRKFQSALRQRYMMLFSLSTNIDRALREEYKGIEYTFKRTMPIDYLSQAQASVATASIASTETALKIMDAVTDVQDEMKRIEEEKKVSMELLPAMGGFEDEESNHQIETDPDDAKGNDVPQPTK